MKQKWLNILIPFLSVFIINAGAGVLLLPQCCMKSADGGDMCFAQVECCAADQEVSCCDCSQSEYNIDGNCECKPTVVQEDLTNTPIERIIPQPFFTHSIAANYPIACNLIDRACVGNAYNAYSPPNSRWRLSLYSVLLL